MVLLCHAVQSARSVKHIELPSIKNGWVSFNIRGQPASQGSITHIVLIYNCLTLNWTAREYDVAHTGSRLGPREIIAHVTNHTSVHRAKDFVGNVDNLADLNGGDKSRHLTDEVKIIRGPRMAHIEIGKCTQREMKRSGAIWSAIMVTL
jgi:hypothetical protein